MGTRGKSTATIKVLNTLPPERIKAPRHLTSKQKRIWTSIVSVLPEHHFVKADFPILEAYVLGIEIMRDAAKKLDTGDEVSPWLKVFESQQSRLGNLAVKLRLAPSARSRVDQFKVEDKKKTRRDLG